MRERLLVLVVCIANVVGAWANPGVTPLSARRGDLNCDGLVNAFDIDPFVLALTATPPAYSEYYVHFPGCDHMLADANADGLVNAFDIDPFVVLLTGPGPTLITLNGASITVDGSGVTVNGTQAIITAEGVYEITGTLTDGQIMVDSLDGGPVELHLDGINVSNSTTAPLYVASAASTTIVLTAGSSNYLTDPGTYVYPPGETEPNAALFSNESLLITGTGSLIVHGNYNDAISSDDDLTVTGGAITVVAVDDGIRGKDYLDIQGGDFTVTAGGDGLKSDNVTDPGLGNVTISAGTIHVTAGGDAIAAEKAVNISGGDFTLTSGGGHTVTPPADGSAKGIKGSTSLSITGGTFNLDCSDDGVHCNGPLSISAADLTIATKDDGIHSDTTTHIISGTINITTSYEAINGTSVAIDDGTFHITSTNDALDAEATISIVDGNFTIVSGGGHTVTIPASSSAKAIKAVTAVTVAGGTFNIDAADDGLHCGGTITVNGGTFTIATNSSISASYGDGIHCDSAVNISGGNITIGPCYEGIEASHITINNGTIHITSTDDGINAAGGAGTSNWVHFYGGYVAINASGDGIDSNGSIAMTAGTVIVHGPTQDMNAAIDYDTTFLISGGLLVAAGSAGMAQAPSSSSTQRSVKITYATQKTAGTLAHIETTTGGTNIVTFAPAKQYRSLVVSSPAFTAGLSCRLYRAGTCSGTPLDGLYTDGTYTPGTLTNTFTTSSIVTNVSAP